MGFVVRTDFFKVVVAKCSDDTGFHLGRLDRYLADSIITFLMEIIWAFSFMGHAPLSLKMQGPTRRAAYCMGARIDIMAGIRAFHGTRLSGSSPNQHHPTQWISQMDTQRDAAPRTEMDLNGLVLVFKPSGWAVYFEKFDGPVRGATLRDASAALPLYLQAMFPAATCPVLHCEGLMFGFLHRLDVACSGLLLVGKTHTGLLALRWQLERGSIAREYVIQSHGHIAQDVCKIVAPVQQEHFSFVSFVHAQGSPAETAVRLIAAMGVASSNVFSMVSLRIHTGRTHQIRVHMQFCRHPVVQESKYGPLSVRLHVGPWFV
eukprot:gnl/MRDRNA2_/MRDRNA2_23560_c0_seq1.p1 gnl/MRDRNA2_/MRDRNA2_23560_c0~~gnl/MRDRNA2_/MRDRNA2_23560_c0_seq1.p1  ORF type:complete len:318 (+),score=35.51 gnl/MRDRNA2_/MRDRNA2_23560_c0_seq1:170-1123(+)